LTVGILSPRSIAPWLTSSLDPYGSLVVSTMCDQVLDLDPKTAELVPSVASAFRLQEPHLMTLKVRKTAKFPDGTRVTGRDVADSISRAARFEIASPVADALKLVKGFEQLNSASADDQPDRELRERLAGVSVPDPGSVEVSLKADRPDLFRLLAAPLASVVPSRAFRKDPAGMERKPECVGPYRLTEAWQPGAPSIRLVRNRDYTPADVAYTGGGAGYADSIEFRVFPDRAAAFAAYQAGSVDIAYAPVGGADVVVAPTPTLDFIGLPVSKPPFDQRNVRLALSAALDRRALVHAPLSPHGRFLPDTLPLGLADDSKVTCAATAKLDGDLRQAKQLLADAHVDLNGVRVKLLFNDEFDNRALVEAVAKQWQAGLGLQAEPTPMPWQSLLDAAGSVGGLGSPFRLSWTPEAGDPTEYLGPLFLSSAIGVTNWAKFADRSFDKQLAETANGKVDEGDRSADLLEAESQLCQDMPMIPVAEGGVAYAVRQSRVASAAGPFTDRATAGLLLREVYLK
jgi:ABC-type oligopeptide transport system substrate-binding subunit